MMDGPEKQASGCLPLECTMEALGRAAPIELYDLTAALFSTMLARGLVTEETADKIRALMDASPIYDVIPVEDWNRRVDELEETIANAEGESPQESR